MKVQNTRKKLKKEVEGISAQYPSTKQRKATDYEERAKERNYFGTALLANTSAASFMK